MTPIEKKERLNYLRFRMKVIASSVLFIYVLKKGLKIAEAKRMRKTNLKVIIDDHRQSRTTIATIAAKGNTTSRSMILWFCWMSVWLWFNLITAPFLILWPDIIDIKTLFYLLWLNEFIWIIDIIRKFFVKPAKSTHQKSDIYENAIAYIKSTLILDLISTFPQVVSGLGNEVVPLKILRLYQVWLLHYPFEAIVNYFYARRDRRNIFVIIYAYQTLCRIFMLLHYLAIGWVWIGSADFIDFEVGYDPWSIDIEDFQGNSEYQLYIFSVYWVCTVVTTVGYGDYAGGTSLEILYTICLEFFGIVVFAVL